MFQVHILNLSFQESNAENEPLLSSIECSLYDLKTSGISKTLNMALRSMKRFLVPRFSQRTFDSS